MKIRIVHRHSQHRPSSQSKGAFAMAFGGFTITNGVTSVSYDGTLDHSKIAKELRHFQLKRVYVPDLSSFKKIKDLAIYYPEFFKKDFKVEKKNLKIDQSCEFCTKQCHRWMAVNCLSKVLKFSHDPITH